MLSVKKTFPNAHQLASVILGVTELIYHCGGMHLASRPDPSGCSNSRTRTKFANSCGTTLSDRFYPPTQLYCLLSRARLKTWLTNTKFKRHPGNTDNLLLCMSLSFPWVGESNVLLAVDAESSFFELGSGFACCKYLLPAVIAQRSHKPRWRTLLCPTITTRWGKRRFIERCNQFFSSYPDSS